MGTGWVLEVLRMDNGRHLGKLFVEIIISLSVLCDLRVWQNAELDGDRGYCLGPGPALGLWVMGIEMATE